jgi:hypothetical protein
MRTINVAFEDSEIEKLEAKKDGRTWHDFILLLLDLDEAR